MSMSRLFSFLLSLDTELPPILRQLYTFLGSRPVLFSPFLHLSLFTAFLLVVTTCVLLPARHARSPNEVNSLRSEPSSSRPSSASSDTLPGGTHPRSDDVLAPIKRPKSNPGLALSLSSSPAHPPASIIPKTTSGMLPNQADSSSRSTKWNQGTFAPPPIPQVHKTHDPSQTRRSQFLKSTPPRNSAIQYQDRQPAAEDLQRHMGPYKHGDLEFIPSRFHRSRRKRDSAPIKAQRQAQNFPPLDSQFRCQNKSPFNFLVDGPLDSPPKQPYDAFLVVDIEGTCQLGTDFNYPNEIIEFPVCLLQWVDKTEDGRACELKLVDEFRSFVKPTWRPTLSDFCKDLTGITQNQVDSAPYFPEVLTQLEAFLVKNGLMEGKTGQPLKKFCWCSDGPFDIRDFVVKQCFISKVKMPSWLARDVLDIRLIVLQYLSFQPPSAPETPRSLGLTCRSLNIPTQLKVLGLPAFEGREHSGIDDTRNVSRVLVDLGRRGMCLLPNTTIHPSKRWSWMGKDGQILDELLTKL